MANNLARPGGDSEVAEALDKLITLTNNMLKAGLFHSGTIKSGVALTTSDTPVYHGLGRVPTICMPTYLTANAVVYVVTPHGDPRNYINVRASASVTASLLIA